MGCPVGWCVTLRWRGPRQGCDNRSGYTIPIKRGLMKQATRHSSRKQVALVWVALGGSATLATLLVLLVWFIISNAKSRTKKCRAAAWFDQATPADVSAVLITQHGCSKCAQLLTTMGNAFATKACTRVSVLNIASPNDPSIQWLWHDRNMFVNELPMVIVQKGRDVILRGSVVPDGALQDPLAFQKFLQLLSL